ncbi:hypothetical protein EON65_11605, partial [archaeon]
APATALTPAPAPKPLKTVRDPLTEKEFTVLRQEQEEKRRKEYADKLAAREAKDKAATEEQMKKKLEGIDRLLAFLKMQSTLDLVFLSDITGSMQSSIDSIKNKITDIVQDMKALCPDLAVRLAFVGYRDYVYNSKTKKASESAKNPRLVTNPFTTNMDQFVQFIAGLEATGGDDQAEDVLGGMNVVAFKGWWESAMRVVFHIADAPCHGYQYNGGCNDDFPAGCPIGLKPLPILQQLQADNVKYIFIKLNKSTDRMVDKFNAMMSKGVDVDDKPREIPGIEAAPETAEGEEDEEEEEKDKYEADEEGEEVDGEEDGESAHVDGESDAEEEESSEDEASMAGSDEEPDEDSEEVRGASPMLAASAESKGSETEVKVKPFIEVKEVQDMCAMSIVSQSLSVIISQSVSTGTARTNGGDKKPDIPMETKEPDWSDISLDKVTVFPLKQPADLKAVLQQEGSCVHPYPLSTLTPVQVQMAPYPFGGGADCLAFKAKIQEGILVPSLPTPAAPCEESTGEEKKEKEEGSEGMVDVVIKKLHKERARKMDVEKVLAPHCGAKFIAQQFNLKKPAECEAIEYVPACLIQFVDRRASGRDKKKQDDQPIMILEQRIMHPFEKFSDNAGNVTPSPTPNHHTVHDAVQAFSHFSFDFSEQQMLVVDCQGGYDLKRKVFQLTDPAIHCKDMLKYGGTNLWVRGMRQFFKTHRCNGICKAMDLKVPTAEELDKMAQSTS